MIWCRFLSWFRPEHFFTGGRVIMDYELYGIWVKNILMLDLFHLLSSPDVNWWTGVVWIIVMFLSSVWTLILTAPIHFHWWDSDAEHVLTLSREIYAPFICSLSDLLSSSGKLLILTVKTANIEVKAHSEYYWTLLTITQAWVNYSIFMSCHNYCNYTLNFINIFMKTQTSYDINLAAIYQLNIELS